MQSKRKVLIALIAAMALFITAAVFVLVNIKSRIASAQEEVEIVLEMLDENNKQVEGGIVYDISDNETKTAVGPGTIHKDSSNPLIFSAEANYYDFTGLEITWEGKIYINENLEETGYYYSDNPVFSQTKIEIRDDGAEKITITFLYEAKEYEMKGISGYIENNRVSKNDAGVDINLKDAASDNPFINTIMVKIGTEVILNIPDEGENQEFYKYALWNTQGFYEYQEGLLKNGSITLSKKFFDDYLLADGTLEIIGAFVKIYSVGIFDFESRDYSYNFIELTIYNRLTKELRTLNNKDEIKNYFNGGIKGFYEGTYIKVAAKDIPYFKFEQFKVTNENGEPVGRIEDENGDAVEEFTINLIGGYEFAGCKIQTEFVKYKYSLKIEGFDSIGRNIPLIDNLEIKINDSAVTDITEFLFSIGDTLSIKLTKDDLYTDYSLYGHYLSLKEGAFGSFKKLDGTDNIENYSRYVDYNFLNEYVNSNAKTASYDGVLSFNIDFISGYSFSIDYDEAINEGLGTFDIDIDGEARGADKYGNTVYDRGTKITVSLKKSDYAVLSLGGAYDNEISGNTITIILNNSNRKLSIAYLPLKFSLTDNTQIENYSVSNLKDLRIGSFIEMSFGLKESNKYEVKSWYINGVDVLNNLPKDAIYSDGVLKIKITEDWLKEFENFQFTNTIKTGLKASYLLIAAGIPSVVIILIIIFVMIFVTNAKRKRFIKAELLDEKMKGYTYNSGNMISDLKDDKFMKVSKEEIKARKKQQDNEARTLKKRRRNFIEDLKEDKLSNKEINEQLEGASLLKKGREKPADFIDENLKDEFRRENFKEEAIITQEEVKAWREQQKEDLSTHRERQRQFEEDLKRAKEEIEAEKNQDE